MPSNLPAPPVLQSLCVEGYKAFQQPAELELAPLTLILGRNNAGKTALCFAPVYFTHALSPTADAPFPKAAQGIEFGPLQQVCFGRRPSGLKGTLRWKDSSGALTQVILGAAANEGNNFEQVVTELEILEEDGHQTLSLPSWSTARQLLQGLAQAASIPAGIRVLRGERPPMPAVHTLVGHTPDEIGPQGENTALILAAAANSSGGLDELNGWFEQIRVRIGVLRLDKSRDSFEITATGPSGQAVNLSNSGAGLAQVLPLAVSVYLAKTQPSLFCIEQPELHLHPKGHIAAAELLLESLRRHPETRLLVETHSDGLILRIRREIASGALDPRHVRIYFVDEDGEQGSQVKPIELDDRGTPNWWPKGVFAEPQQEYFRIRQAIAQRERHS